MNIHAVSLVQLLSHVRFFATPWTASRQASLSITNSRNLLKHKSTELVMPSNHLILSCFFLLLPSIFASNRVFSNESVLCIRWPIRASASASVLLMNIQDWFPLGLTGLTFVHSEGLSSVFSNTIVQKQQFISAELSLRTNTHIHIWPLEKLYSWIDRPLLAKVHIVKTMVFSVVMYGCES